MTDTPPAADQAMTVACPGCGQQTPLTSTECQSCGSPLDSVDPQWAAEAASGDRGGWTKALTGIGCGVLLLVAAVGAFFIGCFAIFRFQ